MNERKNGNQRRDDRPIERDRKSRRGKAGRKRALGIALFDLIRGRHIMV